MMQGFYSEAELASLGLKCYGRNVLISRRCSIYGAEQISIGNNVRIDDFCVISAGNAGIDIGNFVHIAVYVSLIGAALIKVGNFVGISSRCSIYSSNDDYSGAWMSVPVVPNEYRNVTHAKVLIGNHALIGSGCVILPGVDIGDGVAVGALSLVNKSCESYSIYVGTPAKKIKDRKRDFLLFEKELVAESV